jgi:hypothetical protein
MQVDRHVEALGSGEQRLEEGVVEEDAIGAKRA